MRQDTTPLERNRVRVRYADMSTHSSSKPVIVWFRRDLRTTDHAALHAAAETGKPVIALFIREADHSYPMGAASDWFLHYCLKALDEALSVPLVVREGTSQEVIGDIIPATGADEVHWGRRYQKDAIERDAALKEALNAQGITVETHNTLLLSEPWEIKTGGGTPYRVFTPYFRKFREQVDVGEPLPAPNLKHYAGNVESLTVEELGLLPIITPSGHDWGKKLEPYWTPGPEGARERLQEFLDKAVGYYAEYRDRPDYDRTSRLSPFLAHGCISARECWHANNAAEVGSDKFLSELGWREFSYVLLYHNPEMKTQPLNPQSKAFQWEGTQEQLEAWQRGMTGYPIVDAGMRQLWDMGWQHNRVRMITASFLIKDLLVEWQKGEEWFWDCLCGGDPANNSQGWQWVAGCGADASPFFRIFNPISQGERYDPQGEYVKRWCPELKDLPKKWIHRPWEAPDHVLDDAGVTLGTDYPVPMVDHAKARDRALELYKEMRA